MQLYTDSHPLRTRVHAAALPVFLKRRRACGWSSSRAQLAPSGTADTFRMYNAVFWLYHAANAGMCNTGCKSWQAKQFLFGSGYFTVVCLWYNMPFCPVLRHHLLILCWFGVGWLVFSVHLFCFFIILNVSARITRSTPILNNRALVGHNSKFDSLALPQRLWYVVSLLLAASSGYICDPWC